MQIEKMNDQLYDKASLFTGSILAFILLGIWSFFEASFWFVLPDFLLLLLCLLRPEKYLRFFVLSLVASVVGISSYYGFVVFDSGLAREILDDTPFVNQGMIGDVGGWYTEGDLLVLLKQSVSNIPVKVWTYLAVEHELNLFVYVCGVGISRAVRMFMITFVFAILGRRFAAGIRRRFLLLSVGYVVLFFFVMFTIT